VELSTPVQEGQRRRHDRERGDRADGTDRPDHAHEELAEEAEERVGADVRCQDEEALLERRLSEPVAHRDEPGVRGQPVRAFAG
jgi:hypothetical protein